MPVGIPRASWAGVSAPKRWETRARPRAFVVCSSGVTARTAPTLLPYFVRTQTHHAPRHWFVFMYSAGVCERREMYVVLVQLFVRVDLSEAAVVDSFADKEKKNVEQQIARTQQNPSGPLSRTGCYHALGTNGMRSVFVMSCLLQLYRSFFCVFYFQTGTSSCLFFYFSLLMYT